MQGKKHVPDIIIGALQPKEESLTENPRSPKVVGVGH